MSSIQKNITVLILGDAGVGKSTFINKLITGSFPCVKKEDKPYKLYTNKGVISIKFIISEHYPLDPEITKALPKIDAVVIMFDKTSPNQNFTTYIDLTKDIKHRVLCGNKYDVSTDVSLKAFSASIHKIIHDKDIHYYDISAKSNYQFEKPMLYLSREIYGKDIFTQAY